MIYIYIWGALQLLLVLCVVTAPNVTESKLWQSYLSVAGLAYIWFII